MSEFLLFKNKLSQASAADRNQKLRIAGCLEDEVHIIIMCCYRFIFMIPPKDIRRGSSSPVCAISEFVVPDKSLLWLSLPFW